MFLQLRLNWKAKQSQTKFCTMSKWWLSGLLGCNVFFGLTQRAMTNIFFFFSLASLPQAVKKIKGNGKFLQWTHPISLKCFLIPSLFKTLSKNGLAEVGHWVNGLILRCFMWINHFTSQSHFFVHLSFWKYFSLTYFICSGMEPSSWWSRTFCNPILPVLHNTFKTLVQIKTVHC